VCLHCAPISCQCRGQSSNGTFTGTNSDCVFARVTRPWAPAEPQPSRFALTLFHISSNMEYYRFRMASVVRLGKFVL
jgi:hypothetical protein